MNTNRQNKTLLNHAQNTVATGYKTSKNFTYDTYNKFQSSSTIVKVFTVIIILFVIILLFMWISNMLESSKYKSKEAPFIITQPVNAFRRGDQPVKTQRIPDPIDGLEFSYSLWIYIANWNYKFGDWKNIFLKGNENRRAPGLWLYPKTNSLHARINTHADPNEGCDIRNIPLQKWVHITYVLNNRTVTIYIDGKLERSCVLRGVPVLNRDRVQIATDGGFFGQIAKMQYFLRALMPNEISEIYSEGPYIAKKYSIPWFSNNNDKKDMNDDFDDDYDKCTK